MIYSTYMGGPGPDGYVKFACGDPPQPGNDYGYDAYAIAVDSLGSAYTAGVAYFSAYPTGISLKNYGHPDGFTSKFAFTSFPYANLTFTASPNPQKPGGPITLATTVIPTSGTAVSKGSVFFTANNTTYQATVGANGKAQFTIASGLPSSSGMTYGEYMFSAIYSGWINFNGSLTTTTSEFVGITSTPTFSLAAGSYASPHTITLADANSGAVFYYKLNGAAPTTSSTQYTGTISKTSNVQAIAIAPGHTNSAIATARYAFVAAPPTFSLAAGTYTGTQTLSITDASAGTAIYYTTDGATPTTSSTKLTGALKITASETVKVIADGNGFASSVVVSEAYKIQ